MVKPSRYNHNGECILKKVDIIEDYVKFKRNLTNTLNVALPEIGIKNI